MVKTMHRVTTKLFILTFVWPNIAFSQYLLEKVEEFKINSLYPVEIVDHYPQDNLYLGYINASEGTRIALINGKGEFVANEMLVGEGPNQSVSLLLIVWPLQTMATYGFRHPSSSFVTIKSL